MSVCDEEWSDDYCPFDYVVINECKANSRTYKCGEEECPIAPILRLLLEAKEIETFGEVPVEMMSQEDDGETRLHKYELWIRR